MDHFNRDTITNYCVVAEPNKVLVGEQNEWVANPLGPDQKNKD